MIIKNKIFSICKNPNNPQIMKDYHNKLVTHKHNSQHAEINKLAAAKIARPENRIRIPTDKDKLKIRLQIKSEAYKILVIEKEKCNKDVFRAVKK